MSSKGIPLSFYEKQATEHHPTIYGFMLGAI